MIKTPFKKIMFITMLIIFYFSCTNQKQKELASTDIIKSVENDGYHSSDPKDTNIPYTTIIRFKGDY